MKNRKTKLLFVANVDWYFKLHWMDRMHAARNAGYDIYLATNFSDEEFFREQEAAGINVIDVNLSRSGLNPFAELWAIFKIFKLVNHIKPDIIHSITVKPNLYAGIIARIRKLPVVCSITGLGVIFSHKSRKNRIIKLLISFCYRVISQNKKSIFLFENNSDKELFIDKNIIAKARAKRISGAGVDIEAYNHIYEEDDSTLSILFAARLLEDKGLRSLVEAAKIMNQRALNIELRVAGIFDENAQNAISRKEIEKWSDQKDIVWLGTRSDMPGLISASSIVCLPTTYGEGIPRILIESCACGRPVVTTDVSGCNEFVKDGYNGLLVPPNDTSALVEALTRLAKSASLRREMGVNGRTLVANEYTKEIVIDQTLETYNELLA